ncbi:hypothetical protein HN827_03600 [archaeon]|jgi:hypothetical protein|nr:hypothetical protein [archaeon]
MCIIVFRKISIFFILTLIVSTFTYINYYIKLPIDISPVIFLSLVFSRDIGIFGAIMFIIASGIIPMVLAGGSFDHTTLFYLTLIILINYASLFFLKLPFLYIAFSLIILHHVIAFFGSISFGTPKHKEMINLIVKIFVDSFYILTFSEFIFYLMR